MRLEVCIIDKVKDPTDGPQNSRIGGSCKSSQEYFFHVLVFISGPLGNKRDALLEMS